MSAPQPDLDFLNRGLMTALRAIGRGGILTDSILVPPYGQSSTIVGMLALASQHLNEPFHAEDWGSAEKALRRVGISMKPSNKNVVARALAQQLLGNKLAKAG